MDTEIGAGKICGMRAEQVFRLILTLLKENVTNNVTKSQENHGKCYKSRKTDL